jgi:hypothetical protein
MSSLAINIVPDDKTSIVAGPFTGNPITCMNICWAMPSPTGDVINGSGDDNAANNTGSKNINELRRNFKDIDGAVVVGHANGAVNIYSENASIESTDEEQKLLLQQQQQNNSFDDDEICIIKWKKQRMQPHRTWLRRKIVTRLDEAIIGVECDCINCYLVVGIKRGIQINVSDRKKIKQTHFRFGKKVFGPKRRHSTFGYICNKKVVCIQCQGPSYFIDYQNNTEGVISTSKIEIVHDAYISDFDGNRVLVVENDDEAMEFRIHVESLFEDTDNHDDEKNQKDNGNDDDSNSNDTHKEDEKDSNSGLQGGNEEKEQSEEEDEFENVVISYNLNREPWGFKLVSTNAFSVIESDRIVTLYNCKTLEEIYKPLKLDSRIVTFCVVKATNPEKHMLLFICRDNTLKLYLNGEIVTSNLLPSSKIHSFAMSLPYICACDTSVNGKVFYNDDNYLYHYNIPDDMLKCLAE